MPLASASSQGQDSKIQDSKVQDQDVINDGSDKSFNARDLGNRGSNGGDFQPPNNGTSWGLLSLLTLATVVLIGYLGLYWALPVYIINQAQNLYQQQGDDYQLTIGHWLFAPHRGELKIEDVVFSYAGQKKSLAAAQLVINPAKLLDSKIVIETLSFDNWQLEINSRSELSDENDTEILSINGYLLPASQSKKPADNAQPTTAIKQNLAELIASHLPDHWLMQW